MDNVIYTIENNGYLIGLYTHEVLAERKIIEDINVARAQANLPLFDYSECSKATEWSKDAYRIRELYL